MPQYLSKTGMLYSEEEIAKIINNENWSRMDSHQPAVEDHEVSALIESYEREKRYGDTSGRR